ncbi:MAG: hypothetical protein AB7F96_04910 [Beijerinckiaceae bacterium]
MPIVYATGASHAPGMTAWTEAAPVEQKDRLFSAFERMRQSFAASKPDVVLTLTSEHWINFFLDHVGAFCIGRADYYDGPVEPWLRVEKARIPGDAALAEELLSHCYASGFELNYSHEMALDHGTIVPLHFLMPEKNIPIVPIMFNTLATPRPTAARCVALGQALRPVLQASSKRIAIVATGGLSHDPGEVGHGHIDQEFDARFIEHMRKGDLAALSAYTDKELLAAGAGTLELLAWMTMAGIMGERGADLVAYEAVKPWATGVGIMSYEMAA